MIWLLTLPFRFLWLGFKLGSGSVRLTRWSVRALGYRRLLVFGAGVGVGLLVAPGSGAELRDRLRGKLAELRGTAPSADLAARVAEELASSPRTWHLPQPTVTEAGPGRITLEGAVPDGAAAADLESTARGVRGVTLVDSRLTVRTA